MVEQEENTTESPAETDGNGDIPESSEAPAVGDKPEGKVTSIKVNYIFSLMNKMVSVLVPILITPYLARVLEPDGNGLISYISSIASYFVLVANVGIETYGQRLISIHRNDRAFLKKVFWEISVLRAVLTALCLVVYYFCFISSFNKNDNILYAINAITVLAVVFDFTWFFQGVENFKVLAISTIVSKVLYVVLVFVLVKEKADISIATLLSVGSLALPFVLSFPFAFKYIGGKIEGKFNPFIHLKECMVYFIPTVAVQIYTVLDKTMIGLITQSNFENGYYEQADKLIKLPLTLITTLFIIMRSRISYYYSIGETDKIKSLINKSANIAFGLSLPLMLGMIAIAPKLVAVYLGEGYESCVTLIYVLSPLIPIISLSNLLGTHYYTPFDKQKISNIFLVSGAGLNLVLNIGLIFALGSVGASIASVCAELLITVLYCVFAREFVPLGSVFKISIKYLVAATVMFVSVFIMDIFLPISVWYLILEICSGMAIYFVFLLILKVDFIYDYLRRLKNVFRKKE